MDGLRGLSEGASCCVRPPPRVLCEQRTWKAIPEGEVMEETQAAYPDPTSVEVIRALAEQLDPDTPMPERLVVQQVNPEVYVCRVEVRNDDQPYGVVFRLRPEA